MHSVSLSATAAAGPPKACESLSALRATQRMDPLPAATVAQNVNNEVNISHADDVGDHSACLSIPPSSLPLFALTRNRNSNLDTANLSKILNLLRQCAVLGWLGVHELLVLQLPETYDQFTRSLKTLVNQRLPQWNKRLNELLDRSEWTVFKSLDATLHARRTAAHRIAARMCVSPTKRRDGFRSIRTVIVIDWAELRTLSAESQSETNLPAWTVLQSLYTALDELVRGQNDTLPDLDSMLTKRSPGDLQPEHVEDLHVPVPVETSDATGPRKRVARSSVDS